jgi:spore germination protein KC
MWAHNNVVIIGESLAKESIIPVADFFTHNPELRMRTPVVVAHGDAQACIEAKAGMETPSGLSFIYFHDYGSLLAETVQSTMLTVSADLAQRSGQPIIAAISLKEMESGGEGEGGKSKDGQAKTINLSGAAVFRRNRMIGWLTPDETRGVAWILNQTRNAVVTVIDPDHGNQSVAVETDNVKSKITSKVVQGIPQIIIKITGGGGIVEEDGSTDQSVNQFKKGVAKLVEQQIESDIRLSLKKIQREYKVDVFGLSTYVHYQNDWEWESGLRDKWVSIFPRVPIRVQARIYIHSNILKQEPMKVSR